MLFHTLLAGLGLVGLAAAAPTKAKTADRSSGPQNVLYWGSSGGQKDLAEYCTDTAGVDILVLAFLDNWGVTSDIPSGSFGPACAVNSDGTFGQSCSDLASQIKTCQSAGVKVIASLGGGAGSYTLASQSQAQKIGQYLWDAYGKPGNTTVQRPFGDVAIDGWDFDLEHGSDADPAGRQYYPDLVSTLRDNFAKDTSKTYYITGAPQCPCPDASVGDAITNSVFDYLFVQFYNNNPTCSLGVTTGPFNYYQWADYLASTKSSNAKIFVGAPAAQSGSNGASTGFVYYATPSQLTAIVKSVKSDSHFGGVMLWDAGWSEKNVISNCTFSQQVSSILKNGAPCKGTPDDGAPPAPPPPASSFTTPSAPAGSSSPSYSPPAAASSAAASLPPASPPPASTPVVSSPPAGSSPASSPPAGSSPASSLSDDSSSYAAGSSGSGGSGVAQWGQCGGEGYAGPTQCQSPFSCVKENAYWSSCQ